MVRQGIRRHVQNSLLAGVAHAIALHKATGGGGGFSMQGQG